MWFSRIIERGVGHSGGVQSVLRDRGRYGIVFIGRRR